MLSKFFEAVLYLCSFLPFIFAVFGVAHYSLRNGGGRLLALPIGLCFGPVLLSLVLEFFFAGFPRRSDAFYVTVVLSIGTSLALLSLVPMRKSLVAALANYRGLFERQLGLIDLSLLLLCLGGVVLALATAFLLPLRENDPLEYASTARQLLLLKDSTQYPFVNTDVSSGYYGPWSHGLGYINLWVWNGLLGDQQMGSAGARLVSSYYVFATGLALLSVNWGSLFRGRLISALLYIGTPIIFVNAISSHIDTIRIATFFLVLCLFYCYLLEKSNSLLLLSAFLSGLALYTHSLNLLILPLIGWVWLLHERKLSFGFFARGTLFIFLALIVVVPRYMKNVEVFGSPIADFNAVQVWQVESLYFEEWLRLARRLDSWFDRLFFGVGKGLSQPDRFGLAYYVFFVALILYVRDVMRDGIGAWRRFFITNSWTGYFFQISMIFMAMVIVSWAVGLDSFIKNERYTLTIQPIVLAFSIPIVVQKLKEKHGKD